MNKRSSHGRSRPVLGLLLISALVPAALVAQQPTVTPISGIVEIRVSPGSDFLPVTEAAAYPGDAVLRTGSNGFALINYTDSTEIVVRPGTEVELGGENDEGIRVRIGRVLLRVRRLFSPGQERAHRTPTTVAAVRGTEFGLAVDSDGVTSVFVFEGRVAVSNHALTGPPIEVDAGSVTTVAPLRPPTEPRRFQSGEFERGSAGEVERGEDRAVEAGQAPTTARYLAFPDRDLDALENPAYLSVGPGNGASALLLGSGSSGGSTVTVDGVTTFDENDGGSRGLAQALAWATLGSSVRVGVFAQGDIGVDRAVREVRVAGADASELLQQGDEWSVGEGRFMAAFQRGRTAFGLAVGHREGTRDAEVSPAGSVVPPVLTDGDSDISTLSVGVRRDGRRTWGLSYHRAEINARIETGADVVDTEGSADAVEALVRSWNDRSGWGGWLRLERSTSAEDRWEGGAFIYREDLEVLTLRAGLGLGFMPTEEVLLSFDVAAGAADEAAQQTGPAGVLIEDEADLRLSGSVHLGAQMTISGPWRAEVSVLHTVERIDRTFDRGSNGSPITRIMDVRSFFGTRARAGLLYDADRWTVRYAVSSPVEPGRAWVHSLLVAVGPR